MATNPIFFWRETSAQTGYLSQWYLCPFRDDQNHETVYDTAEHYMMHHKALLFGDQDMAAQILKPGTHPRKAKELGRKVKGYSDSVWREHREAIVLRGNMLKFTNAVSEQGFRMGSSASKATRDKMPLLAGGSLRETLLSTGDAELVEASPFDRIWGVGFKAADAEVNRARWGLNLLGKALMEVRETLRQQQTHQSGV